MSSMVHDSVLRVRNGIIRGTAESGVHAFRGIPYAAPPFGTNRMRPPRQVPAWEGERDAREYGPTAPKGDYPPQFAPLFPEVTVAGEDCLNLNVWTPDPGANGLPVLVWLHGGSFTNGSSSVGEYEGSAFARDGVVCVTVNYRLGAEGFLFLGDDTANLGLLDQLAALRWVQDNIAVFGGDPARVTLAGESAGAMSVATLLSMPQAEGLFTRAIAQSGATAHTLTGTEARTVGGYLADALGVAPDREAIKAVPTAELVRAASGLVAEAQTAPDPARWGRIALNLLPFAPALDGSVLRTMPIEAITAGQGAEVPLLIGSNRDEARLFLVPSKAITAIDEQALETMAGAYGLTGDELAVYRSGRPGDSAGDILAAVITDWYYRIPAIRVSEARIAAGAAETWMYRFDRPEPVTNHGLGACHGAEIPFVFDTIARPELRPRLGEAPSQAVADRTHRAWVEFVTHGDPGWAPYDTASRTTGLLTEELVPVEDPAAAERALWEGIR
ncbi:carboxylesterase/lipase family protein [Sciscionella sediminilitoris]|uniref:carboxylesterase/lipase family protein n=1 Tax=Sciscionella sediminilitoris TaxID=1445613 RepID=UPI00068EEC3A|nr:carboxylesterase/lipase family protein [Sciscionella sp. SE31]